MILNLVEDFFRLHSRAMEEKKGNEQVQKGGFLAN